MKLSEMKKLYKAAKVAYYNEDDSIMSDDQFDSLEDQIREQDPDWKELHMTGVRVENAKEEVPLFEFMPSLEKCYPDDHSKFQKRYPKGTRVFSMPKFDGTSLQLKCVNKKPKFLITRGNGKLGKDVSYLIPALVQYGLIPEKISYGGEVVIRFEALMKKKLFDTKYSIAALGKEKGYKNARAFVNGLFNRSQASKALADVTMVALGVYPSKTWNEPIAKSLDSAAAEGFFASPIFEYKPNPTVETFQNTLQSLKDKYDFAVDGIVVAALDFKMEYTSEDKPKGIYAFKFNDLSGAAQVRVTKIHWKKTRLGRWQPKIMIAPTEMGGVTVKQATAHNPAWMKERGIGEGAEVLVLRSGDVIPKIVGVAKKAEFTPPPGGYEQRGRFFYATDSDTAVTDIRGMHFFCTTLGIELFAETSLGKLYEFGISDVSKLIELGTKGVPSALQPLLIEEFGKGQWPKMYKELKRVLDSTLPLKLLMVASGQFEAGMGVRKLSQLEEHGISMKDLCNGGELAMYERVLGLHGWKEKSAKLLMSGVKNFRKWYLPLKGMLQIDSSLPVKKEAVEGSLTGVNVAWTSYRSKDEEAIVESLGGAVVSYGAKMTVLLYKEGAKFADKIVKAGDKAMTWETFKAKYKIA